MSTKTVKNREDWLDKFAAEAAKHFKSSGYKIPLATLKMSAGFPSAGGLGSRKRTIGQAWPASVSETGHHNVFISPTISEARGANGVGAIAMHELVHVCMFDAYPGEDVGHGTRFGKLARSIGLEGKLTATIAGERLLAVVDQITDRLGEYPHGALSASNKKPQTTRSVKCVCPGTDCRNEKGSSYTVRTTRSWLAIGSPICPVCQIEMLPDLPDDDGDAE